MMKAEPIHIPAFLPHLSATYAAGKEPMSEPTLYIEKTRETPEPVMPEVSAIRVTTPSPLTGAEFGQVGLHRQNTRH